jgi:hypothetical protein
MVVVHRRRNSHPGLDSDYLDDLQEVPGRRSLALSGLGCR